MRKPLIVLTALTLAATASRAQNIEQIAKSDPLIITGVIGTMNTYNSSAMYSSRLSNTVYANANINLYGISMPFSFYYSNSNTSFSYPTFSFNISPTYRNWTLHIGQRSMAFSPYVFNLPFSGVGVEYGGRNLRFGAFYGSLRRAVNDDPTDPYARNPQYSRYAWGAKVGYGNSRNYIDLYFLRAQDRLGSLNESWREQLPAEDNIVVGVRGRLSPFRWMSLSANAATSVHSSDMTAQTVTLKNGPRFDKIFDTRYSTLMRFAGDASLSLNFGSTSAALYYKMVQPDYTSLGISHINTNMHSGGVNLSTSLFRRIMLSGNFSAQADNLSGEQLYTTRGFVYSVNASTMLSHRMSLMLGYNGYLQRQDDGTMHVSDSIRVNRRMNSFMGGISYSIDSESLPQTIGLNASYNENKDLNPITSAMQHSDVTTMAAGLSYSVTVPSIEIDFSAAYSYQQTKGYDTQYKSHVLSAGASRSFLKEKNLHLSANLAYTLNNITGKSRNNSLSANISAGYTLAKVHAFALSAGVYHFNDVSLTEATDYGSSDYSVSLNYTWNFTLLHLKRNSTKKHL